MTIDKLLESAIKKELITIDQINEFKQSLSNTVNQSKLTKSEWINIGLTNQWRLPLSDETKQKMSQSRKLIPSPNKGKLWIHNIQLKKQCLINPDKLTTMINQGWLKGKAPNIFKNDE